jgi:hypothetical protein
MNTQELESKVRAALVGAKRPGNESVSLQNEKGYWRPASELLSEVLVAIEAANAYVKAIDAIAGSVDNAQLRGALMNASLEFESKLNTQNVNLNNAKRVMLKK